ncbi:MAG: class A beta-lactamase-related serine hydrolase [Chloroflexi bacterium]|nr:class A beta-lactamase-related serine hydrolase [Chloroflexota bacterium]
MRNRNSNIILRGMAILLLSIAIVLTITSLIGYSRQRDSYPSGMTIGGVPVGGLNPQAASERVLEIYNTPIEIQYGGGNIQVNPTILGFQLDTESMLAAADLSRTGSSFWGGFWDYLWNRDPNPAPVPLRATITEERLRAYLQTEVAPRYDQPPVAAQPIPGTPNFKPGQPGQTLDIDRAVPLIEDALRSPTNRVVTLAYTQNVAARPTIENLQILMKQIITTSGFDGVIGLYMLDLQNGQEIHFALNQGQDISVEPDVAFTASSTIKIPILVSYFIQHGKAPVDDATNTEILNMIHRSDNPSSDGLMAELDRDSGPLVVTQDMQKIGLNNTFIAGYFAPGSPLLQRFSTPANQRTDVFTDPDPYNQTTTSDIGMLLEDIYQCAQANGGALVAAFPDKIDKNVCQKIINYLESDKIGVLIEAGVPEGTPVAMKHGWVTDLQGIDHDWSAAAIVYTPGGNFVLSIYTYHPVQIVFDPINKLFANLARSVYNYFNLSSQ